LGARLLAPAAFLAAASVAILLIRAGLDNDSNPGPRPPATTRSARTNPQPATTASRQPQRRTYTIQAGDTLRSVALDQGTTVERLLELNPQIDPTSLQVGQRIIVPTT
jgi:LysM repeat protein